MLRGEKRSREVKGKTYLELELQTTGPTPVIDAVLKTAEIGAQIGLRGQIDYQKQTTIERKRDGSLDVGFDVMLLAGHSLRASAGAASLGFGLKAKTVHGVHGTTSFQVHEADLEWARKSGKLCPATQLTSGCSVSPGVYAEGSAYAHPITITKGEKRWLSFERGNQTRGPRLESKKTMLRRTQELGEESVRAEIETRPATPFVTYLASRSVVDISTRKNKKPAVRYKLELDLAKLKRDPEAQAKKLSVRFADAAKLASSTSKGVDIDTTDAESRIREALVALRDWLAENPRKGRRWEIRLSAASIVNIDITRGKMARLQMKLKEGEDGRYHLRAAKHGLSKENQIQANVNLSVGLANVGGDYARENRHLTPIDLRTALLRSTDSLGGSGNPRPSEPPLGVKSEPG